MRSTQGIQTKISESCKFLVLSSDKAKIAVLEEFTMLCLNKLDGEGEIAPEGFRVKLETKV